MKISGVFAFVIVLFAACFSLVFASSGALAQSAPKTGDAAQNFSFPEDADIVNLKTQFGAKGDGKTDDTAAIQSAFNKYAGKNKILYLPNGTYLVSGTISWMANQTRHAALSGTVISTFVLPDLNLDNRNR